MKISSSVIHSTTRIKSLVALLVLTVLSSSWLVLRADVPRVASGTWAAAGEVVVPSGAVSVALADGRVVVAGGKSDGTVSPVISSYDPASGAWAHVGELLTARSGHAMTLLNDGRVLIAGGTASYGPSFDIEIFDPATGTSVHGGDMTLARVDHAAATLTDGRVLIVGGSDGVAPMGLAEIFDPSTGQSQGVANAMSTARVRATATTMLDGHVLVVGGNDGANDLASAEIFDPATGSFFNTGAMQVARSGHVAVLLPNNNQVLIAGGMSAGAAVASAELYADWRDGFSATTPMSAARLGAIAGGLQSHDVAFVAGGGANTGDYYGYATVKTDKDDYWPGEPVTVTGSGWQPGETVVLTISEDADTHSDFIYNAVADEAGNITNSEFAPIQNEVFQHFGMRFYVTARGAASRALNTFTDGNGTIDGTIRDSVTNAVIAGATITCSDVGPNPCNNIKTTTSGANGTYSLSFQFPNNSTTANITVSAPGYATQTQSLTFTNNQTRTIDWNLVPSAKATPTVTVQPVSVTFDGQAHGTTGTVAGVGGADLGAATISYNTADGQAPVNAGSYVATGSFAGNDNYTAASVDAVIIVNKASSTTLVTFEAGPYTYRRSAFTATAAVTGAGGLNQVVPVVYSGDCVNVSVAGCTATATFAGDANHDGDSDTKSIQILKKALTITANDATKILGATLTFAGTEFTVDGLVSGDNIATVTLTSTGAAAGAAVGSYQILAADATGAAVVNYNITYVPGVLKVLYRWDGFLQPINDTAHDLVVMSKFKAGQTIPAKFVLKNAAGAVVQQTGNPEFSRSANLGACEAISTFEDPPAVPADVVPQYKWDGAQYHYNWSTKGLSAGLYRIFANLGDGTAHSVDICLTK
jgi:MBG domain (YGX type)/Galactose oxidase, central domain/Kelch motif